MFDATTVKDSYSNLLGWRQFHDTTEIELPPELITSESGEYYQQKHPALALNHIKATLPPNKDLAIYLDEVVADSSIEMFNDILQYRQGKQYAKSLLQKSVLLNRTGYINDGIVNRNRFVGFQLRVKAATGLRLVIDEIGLQFKNAETFEMYLFHTSKEDYLQKFEVTTTGNGAWKWQVQELILQSFKSGEYHGGAFVLGYYQEDLTGMAINMSNFNWHKGECGSCNGSKKANWDAIKSYINVYPLYVPEGSYVKEKMFDIAEDAFFTPTESFGLNLKLTVDCDLTEFFIENKMTFKNLLALKVTHKILLMMQFSQETNYVEENLKMMIIRALEGDKETNYYNIPQQYRFELKGVQYDTAGINQSCLPCEAEVKAPRVGNI